MSPGIEVAQRLLLSIFALQHCPLAIPIIFLFPSASSHFIRRLVETDNLLGSWVPVRLMPVYDPSILTAVPAAKKWKPPQCGSVPDLKHEGATDAR